MPPKSEAQRRFMRQAATPGGRAKMDKPPPAKVAKEFNKTDPGGKLPPKAPGAGKAARAKRYGFE